MGNEVGVAAVNRALSILDAFAVNDSRLSLAEIAKRTGLYKSTALRLIKSLEKFDYVHRSEDGAYQLGSKPFFLGSLYQRHFRTSDVVPPVLRQMVDQLKEGASLYVRDGDCRVCISHRLHARRELRGARGRPPPADEGRVQSRHPSVHRGGRRALRSDTRRHVLGILWRARCRNRPRTARAERPSDRYLDRPWRCRPARRRSASRRR